MTAPQPRSRAPWPYLGRPQRLLLFCGLAMWFGSLMPWVIIRPFNFSASALARSWTLWAGLMAIAGSMVRRRMLAVLSAVSSGAVVAYLTIWQLIRIFQDCSLSHMVRLRCVPGPGLVVVLAAGAVAIWQGRRLWPLVDRESG